MFKKKKTGCETPKFRKSTVPPQPTTPLMPPVKPPAKTNPPNTGSSVVKLNPNYIPPPSVLPSNMVIQCYLKRGTTEDYKEYNPTLQLNELAVEYDNNEIIGYKLGDGVTKWSELEYVTRLTDVKEFWLYGNDINNGRRPLSKIILNPFTINNYLGGTKLCSEQ